MRDPHSSHCPEVVTCHFMPGEDCGCRLVSLGIDIVALQVILLDMSLRVLHDHPTPAPWQRSRPYVLLRCCNPLDVAGRLSTRALASAMLSVAPMAAQTICNAPDPFAVADKEAKVLNITNEILPKAPGSVRRIV